MPRLDRALSEWLRARARDAAQRLREHAAGAWPPRPRHAAALLAAAVALLGLGGIGFQAGLAGELPSDLDWRSAAVVLARDARPGDAVALSPWWAERARLVLPAGLPVLSFPSYAGEELLGVRRVWLLDLSRAPGAGRDVARELAARSSGSQGPQRLGAIELSRYDLAAPALPLDFLPDRIGSARVSAGGRPCGADGPLAFDCGAARVAREVREVDGRPRPCISVRSGGDGPVEIAVPGARLERLLRGHAGLVAGSARAPAPPVRVTLGLGGQQAAVELSGPGWRSLEVDTSRSAGAFEEVVLTVSSPQDGREVCLDAAALP